MTKYFIRWAIALFATWILAVTPANARFLQTDPVGYEAGPNPYIYGDNDPIDNSDPTGKLAVSCTVDKTGASPTVSCDAKDDGKKDTTLHVTVRERVHGEIRERSKDFHYERAWVSRIGEQGLASQVGIDVKAYSGVAVAAYRPSLGDMARAVLPGIFGANLRILHSEQAMANNKSSTDYWSNKSDDEIIKSLAPGQPEALM